MIEALLPLACAACARGLAPEVGAALPLCASCRAALVDCGPAFCLPCAQSGCSPLACGRGDHRLLRAGFTWNEPLRAVVHAFKFGGADGLAPALVSAAWTAPGYAAAPRPDLVVPVPLHPLR
ncbi:MAG: hypothetical protein ABIP29_07260, partial [Candidatus Eisenbacteria bacterium]